MGDVVLIQQIRMDCTGCQTGLRGQWYNSPHGSESTSRRVASSRRHQRNISRQRKVPAVNRKSQKRLAHDESTLCRIGQIGRRGFSAMPNPPKIRYAGSSSRVKQIVALVPDPIRCEPQATFDLADPVQFQEDFTASLVIDRTWSHQDNTV